MGTERIRITEGVGVKCTALKHLPGALSSLAIRGHPEISHVQVTPGRGTKGANRALYLFPCAGGTATYRLLVSAWKRKATGSKPQEKDRGTEARVQEIRAFDGSWQDGAEQAGNPWREPTAAEKEMVKKFMAAYGKKIAWKVQ